MEYKEEINKLANNFKNLSQQLHEALEPCIHDGCITASAAACLADLEEKLLLLSDEGSRLTDLVESYQDRVQLGRVFAAYTHLCVALYGAKVAVRYMPIEPPTTLH